MLSVINFKGLCPSEGLKQALIYEHITLLTLVGVTFHSQDFELVVLLLNYHISIGFAFRVEKPQ